MFNQTWKKYLPVITILLKRSASSEQTFNLNHTDFERASGGRKMKWSIPAMSLRNGRIQNHATKQTAIATEMLAEMQADEQISKLLKMHTFEISMTNDFKLTIKNITISAEAADDAVMEELIN